MLLNVIAERDFVGTDQERFAAICGDRNPMHMDAVAARRTLVGFPVVHGIHALLWGLDSLFRYLPDFELVSSLRANFENTIYVGERVQAVLARSDKRYALLDVVVGGTRVLRLEVTSGVPQAGKNVHSNGPLLQPSEPLVLNFEQVINCHGQIPLVSAPDAVARMFPAAVDRLGTGRVLGLARSSFLVGMVCPGLHSLYRGLTLLTTPLSEDDHDALHFRVSDSDPRFRLVTLAVSGGGWVGTLDAHVRPAPTGQADPVSIAARVVPGEFAHACALVIGGSRGLGELIGKIIAVGGGHVTLTYAVGEMDARRVEAEITAYGGRCHIIRYDVRKNAHEQLNHLRSVPTQVYYLATPVIARRNSTVFNQQRFQEFIEFYVTAFYELYGELRSRFNKEISFFYPSSVYVDARPKGMTEYAMAKAAGEVLCADIQTFETPGRILVRRLPRLPTDQTASLFPASTADPISVLLPIIREVYANHRNQQG